MSTIDNQVQLIGRLTKDPESREVGSATKVTCSLAQNRKSKCEDIAEFYDFEAWDKTGQLLLDYTQKGSHIAIAGKLKQERWEDANGNKRSRIIVVVYQVKFLDKREDKPAQAESAQPEPERAVAYPSDESTEEPPF